MPRCRKVSIWQYGDHWYWNVRPFALLACARIQTLTLTHSLTHSLSLSLRELDVFFWTTLWWDNYPNVGRRDGLPVGAWRHHHGGSGPLQDKVRRIGVVLFLCLARLGQFVWMEGCSHSVYAQRKCRTPLLYEAIWSSARPLHSLTHSLAHSLPHSRAQSLTHSLTHSLPHSLTQALTRSLAH